MNDLFEISNKNILLVGSTGVLGKTFAEGIAAHGANLVIADLPGSGVMKLAASLGIQAVEIDLSEEASVIDAVNSAVDLLGSIDVAINNSAVTFESLIGHGDAFAKFENYSLDVWNKSIDVNLTGAFLFAREVGRHMKQTGSGNLINISSLYGVVAPDHRIYEGQSFRSNPAYSATKAGLIGFSRWLSTWWAEDNIRVNCISPGGVFNNHNEKFVEKYSNRVPMGRMAERNEMLGALLYLISDASSYCTGQNLIIDGGVTAW